jgi:ferritin-like metal-binding protein YciE
MADSAEQERMLRGRRERKVRLHPSYTSQGRNVVDMQQHNGNGYSKALTAWLQDAYTMEMGLVPVLENHAKDAENDPQLQSRIQQHVEETRHHADLVKMCLERYGEKPNAIKGVIGKIGGMAGSVMSAPFGDEVVKNGLTDFAAENFELASYKALALAAQQAGDLETATVCQQIMTDEQKMANYLDQALPTAVEHAMMKQEHKAA